MSVRGLHRDNDGHYIAEMEVSITKHCSLACDNCGFHVPNQPAPSIGDDPIAELAEGLERLGRLGIRIKSLAVLGGEPTLRRQLLDDALTNFRSMSHIERIEVVTNGLTPQGMSETALRCVDRLSVSVYVEAVGFRELWQSWVAKVAPHVEIIFRESTGGWDPWHGSNEVDDAMARTMYDTCWYRKHCITLERGRIFPCSRIPKSGADHEGLLLDESTSLAIIEAYLNDSTPRPSCRRCTPMMGLPKIRAGVQPDDRLVRLTPRAIQWLGDASRKARVEP
jgi:hypothetical protein